MAAAVTEAEASGEPVVVDELTSEHELVSALPDGTFSAEVSAFPARVARDGGWVPVDASLAVEADGAVRPAATSVGLELSGGGNDPLVRMEDAGAWVELSWLGVLPEPVLTGSTATYPEVLPGVDLVVQAEVTGFSHYLVVKTQVAAANPALAEVTFGLESSGLSAAQLENGATALRDADGMDTFVVPQARMWDAVGASDGVAGTLAAPDGGVAAEALLEPDGSADAVVGVEIADSSVTVRPDLGLLTDPETVFPVVVDPSWTRGKTYWVMVWDDGQEFYNESRQARVGYDGWQDFKKSRVFYRFDVSAFKDADINSARFEHKQVHSPNWDCSETSWGPPVEFARTDGISGSTTWDGPTFYASGLQSSTTVNGHEDTCGGWTRQTWSATTVVRDRVGGGNDNLTVGLRSSNQSDRDGWRKYSHSDGFPKLVVNFNRPPNTPSSLHNSDTGCSDPTKSRPWLNDDTPTLRATISDPDGQNVRAQFDWEKWDGDAYGGGNNAYTAYQSQGQQALTMPHKDDGKYRWRVRAQDSPGLYSDWSSQSKGYCYFVVDTKAPPAPGSPKITAPYGFDQLAELDGDPPQATLTFTKNGDSGVNRFKYSVGSTTPSDMESMDGELKFTPTYGLNVVSVRLVDRADNEGPISTFYFKVASPLVQHAWLLNDDTPGTAADLPRSGGGLALSFGPEVTWDTGSLADESNDPADRALRFDRTGPGAITAEQAVAPVESFTVTARAKVDNMDETNAFVAASLDGEQTSLFKLGLQNGASVWSAWMHTTGRSGGEFVSVQASTGLVDELGDGLDPDGKPDWQHLGLVYDASAKKVRLYVDGHLAAEQSYEFTASSVGRLRIGRGMTSGSPVGVAGGKVDDVVVYDAALNADQIQRLETTNFADELEPTRDQILTKDAVGVWSLDESTGNTAGDGSGRNHTATLQTGASWTAGHVGAGALALDGLSGHARTDGPALDTAGPFSVAAWARLDQKGSWHTIAAQEGTAMSPFRLMYRSDRDAWCFTLRLTDEPGGTLRHACGDPPVVGEWTHLAGVYDPVAGHARLYVNGEIAATVTVETLWASSGDFLIGRTLDEGGSGTGDYFPGVIDEVWAVQDTLSSSEIRYIMEGARP